MAYKKFAEKWEVVSYELSALPTKDFFCGVEALDRYIKQYASQDIKRNLARVFIAQEKDSEKIAGYYTLSASSVKRESLPEKMAKKLPFYPVPVAILGRLAVDKDYQGKGLGEYMLIYAMHQVVAASSLIAVNGIIVDAKDDNARKFYEQYGFIKLGNDTKRLFLPMSIIEKEFI